MNIKENVKFILLHKGMKQTDLAKKMGVSKQQIQSYLNGNITIDNLTKLARAMDTTIATIVAESLDANEAENNTPQSQTTLTCPHCGKTLKITAK